MKKKGLIVFITLMLPMSMLGSTELVYTWGYGDAMWESLQALKGLTSELDYVVKMALAIALFVFSIGKALDSKSSPVFEIGKLFMLYGVVYFFFLSPSNNTYIIHDEVTSKDYKVSKLPMGVGNTISLMSRLEKAILDGMEKHYSTPNSIAYSKAGLGFSLNAMMDIPTLRVSDFDSELQVNMDYYVRNCFQHNMGTRIPYNALTKNSDLLNTILLETDGKLGYYTKGGASAIMTCGEVATEIKKAFAVVVGDATNKVATKNAISTAINSAEYLTKFQAAASIYFGQAAGAREQFQQIMVMNSLDDGIINTAKMLGMNPQSFAANTAIADQTITTSMQAQGRLAQTYLPLAKAYMTIIVVSVSWLMAIISIMFGSYTHIKMFFTLCLSMVLWTPILSLINFLNDLNIQKTFELINANDATLTYANYKDVIQKVTANSNFLKYLVMMTPMLAYALAKGSEMGFVSIASSLSQQLAGGARAAGGFATQQALSTSSAISSPDGSMVSSLTAGKREDVFAANVGGSVVSMSNIGTAGGSMLNHTDTTAGGSRGTQNADGLTTAASVAGLNASQLNSLTKKLGEAKSEAESNYLQSAEGRQFIADYIASHSSGSGRSRTIGVNDTIDNTDTESINKSKTHDRQDFIRASVDGKIGGSIGADNGKGSSVGGGLSINGSMGDAWVNTTTTGTALQKSDAQSLSLSTSDIANLQNNKDFRAAFDDHIATSRTEGAENVRRATKSYEEAQIFTQSFGNDTTATMVNNYKAMEGATQAEALVALESMTARGDLAGLGKYAGMQNYENINGDNIADANYVNYLNRGKVAKAYHNAAVYVNAQSGETSVQDKDGKWVQTEGAATQNFKKAGATIANETSEKYNLYSNQPLNPALRDNLAVITGQRGLNNFHGAKQSTRDISETAKKAGANGLHGF